MPQTDGSRAARPKSVDGFGLGLLRTGITLCCIGAAIGVFWPKPYYWCVFSVAPDAPDIAYQATRWGVVAIFTYGILHGLVSMMAWRSGRYWYRTFRS